jgi:hypothetical protein
MVNTVPVPVYTVPLRVWVVPLPVPYTGIRGFPHGLYIQVLGVSLVSRPEHTHLGTHTSRLVSLHVPHPPAHVTSTRRGHTVCPTSLTSLYLANLTTTPHRHTCPRHLNTTWAPLDDTARPHHLNTTRAAVRLTYANFTAPRLLITTLRRHTHPRHLNMTRAPADDTIHPHHPNTMRVALGDITRPRRLNTTRATVHLTSTNLAAPHSPYHHLSTTHPPTSPQHDVGTCR